MGQPITLGGPDGATLNLGNNDGYDSRGHWGCAGFVGGAILGGGAGYILSREVGDLKGRLGDVHAEIKESQASVEKEISGVTMNMKDQICGTEKLVSSETQRVTGLMGAGFDSMAQRFANQNDRLCGIEKGQEQILCILNNDRAIAEAKREAVEKFKLSQLYDKMMDTTSTASR